MRRPRPLSATLGSVLTVSRGFGVRVATTGTLPHGKVGIHEEDIPARAFRCLDPAALEIDLDGNPAALACGRQDQTPMIWRNDPAVMSPVHGGRSLPQSSRPRPERDVES